MTWQQRMIEKHAELILVMMNGTNPEQERIDALHRAIRLEKILAEEGEFEHRVTV